MRILIANDDGIDAPGIRALIDSLKDEHEIYVCAPSGQRSAASHSVTYFFSTIRVKKVEIEGVKGAWAIDGTPADCVHLGMHGLLKEKPDLVISGVNQGRNLSADCLYSGTVGAAMEALVFNVPGMAVSLNSYVNSDFSVACEYAKRIMPYYMQDEHRGEYIININVPDLHIDDIKGVKFVRFEPGWTYQHELISEQIDENTWEYRTSTDYPLITAYGNGGDGTAILDGYVSVTPIGLDFVHHGKLKDIQDYLDQRKEN